MPATMTAAAAQALRAELHRLYNSAPSRVAAFNEARMARRVEIETLLASVTIEPVHTIDPALEKCLRRAGGGDAIGRR